MPEEVRRQGGYGGFRLSDSALFIAVVRGIAPDWAAAGPGRTMHAPPIVVRAHADAAVPARAGAQFRRLAIPVADPIFGYGADNVTCPWRSFRGQSSQRDVVAVGASATYSVRWCESASERPERAQYGDGSAHPGGFRDGAGGTGASSYSCEIADVSAATLGRMRTGRCGLQLSNGVTGSGRRAGAGADRRSDVEHPPTAKYRYLVR